MNMNLSALLINPAAWQAALDQEQKFTQISAGKIGLASKQTCAAPPGAMLVWEFTRGKVRAAPDIFSGWQAAGVELLLVLDEDTAAALQAALAQETVLAALKQMIRLGKANLFILKPRDELQVLGFEEFLETLGVPFLGTCH